MAVENIKEYWDNRYAKQGFNTTGFIGHNSEENKKCYSKRVDFLEPLVDKYLEYGNSVLDYGCGVGWYYSMIKQYSRMYIGYDVSLWALSYCIQNYINVDSVLTTDFVKEEPSSCQVLFTATVLQHNSNAEVSRILSKYKEAETFLLYEFTGKTTAQHMAQRGINGYEYLVNETTGKVLIEAHSHIVHNQEHTLMIFQ